MHVGRAIKLAHVVGLELGGSARRRIERGDGKDRAFGHVAFVRSGAPELVWPDAIGERIDQRREIGRAVFQRFGEGLRAEWIGAADVERERVDPVARSDLLDPPQRQAQQMRGIASWAGEADAQALLHPVDAVRDQFDRARAEAGFRERGDKAGHEVAQPMLDRVGGGDRFGEALCDDDRFGRDDRVERFGEASCGLVEPGDQRAAEAPGERRAGECCKLPDGVDAEPLEQVDRAWFEPERGGGEGGDRVEMRRRGADVWDVARERPGGTRRIRYGDTRGEAGAGEQAHDAARHPRLPAEQMRGAGDVEEQAVFAR